MTKMLSTLFVLVVALISVAPAAAQSDYTFTFVDYPGAGNTRALGLNDGNEIVGGFGMGGQQHGYLLSGGSFTPIEPPGSAFSRARSINNAHVIVGWNQFTPDGIAHGFLFDGSAFYTLDHPAGVGGTYLYGINDAGQIVGGYVDAAGNEHGAAVLDGVTPIPIDCPGATNTQPFMINNSGTTIVGACDPGRPDGSIGFIYDIPTDTFTFPDIGLPGAVNTAFYGINDSGLIAGSYDDSTTAVHGLIFDGATSTTIDVPGAPDTNLRAINAAGAVVGIYDSVDGPIRGFRADPPPAAAPKRDRTR